MAEPQHELLEDAEVRELEDEGELLRSIGEGTAAIGLAPIPTPHGGSTGTSMKRLRRVRGVKSVRLARDGEYDEDDWDEGPPTVVESPVMQVLIALPLITLIWLLWSLLKSEFITRGHFGSRLSDADLIEADITDGPEHFCLLTLRSQEPVTWFKAIELRNAANTVRMRIYNQGARKQDRMFIPNDELRNGVLVFWKAKQFGIHAAKYTLAGLQEYENKHVTLTWKRDADWHW